MRSEAPDEFQDPAPSRPRGSSLEDRRLAAKRIRQRVEWVHQPLVFWSGRLPEPESFIGTVYRPTLHRIGKRLRGLPPGIYSIEFAPPSPITPWKTTPRQVCRAFNPGIRTVRRIEESDIAQAARALRKALSFPVALAAQVGDLQAWCDRGETALHRVALALRATKPQSSLSWESLALEERCWWVGSTTGRPSHLITDAQLRGCVAQPPDWTSPGAMLTALLLGRRRVAGAKLPRPLQLWYQCGLGLASWPPDLLAQLCTRDLPPQLRSLLEGGRLSREWNRSEAAILTQEFLWAGGDHGLSELLYATPEFLNAVDRLLHLGERRYQQLLTLLEEIDQRCPICLQVYPNRWVSPWDGFERELAASLPTLKPHRRNVEPSPRIGRWRTLDLAFRHFLGVPFPPTVPPPGAFEAPGPDQAKKVLIAKLERGKKLATRAPRPGWVATLCGTAGRISGYLNASQLHQFGTLFEATGECGIPGRHGDDPLRTVQHLVEFWIASTERTPENLERLMQLLGENAHELVALLRSKLGDGMSGREQRKALMKEWWPLGRLGTLSAAEALDLLRSDMLHAVADLLRSRPDRLPKFVAHLRAGASQGSQPSALWPWLLLFGHKEDAFLRWGVASHTRFLERTHGAENVAFEMLSDLLELVNAFREMDGFLIHRTRQMDEVLDSIERSRNHGSESKKLPRWPAWDKGFRNRLFVFRAAWCWKDQGFADEDNLIRFLLAESEKREIHETDKVDLSLARLSWYDAEIPARVTLANGSPDLLWKLLNAPHRESYRWDQAVVGWHLLQGWSSARSLVHESLQSPRLFIRTLELLNRLGLAAKLHTRDALNKGLAQWTTPELSKPDIGHHFSPELDHELALLVAFRAQAGELHPLPTPIRNILNRPAELQRELSHLLGCASVESQQGGIRARIAQLQRLLHEPGPLNAWMSKDLKKVLPAQLQQSELAALERYTSLAIQSHWKEVVGIEAPVQSDTDWDNALRLLLLIKHNKGLLKKLLRNEVRGDRNWIRNYGGNQQWIRRVAVLGFPIEDWLGRFEWRVQMNGEVWRAYTESDPLKVLQMGNLFDTCLSTGSANDFSVVANAVEVNKRVLYLKNDAGTIVGRRLVVLVEHEGRVCLLGFRSYGAGESQLAEVAEVRGEPWVKILFDLMCGRIARQVGASLPQFSIGEHRFRLCEKAVLFARWYDDGAEPFDWWITDESIWPRDQTDPDPSALLEQVEARLSFPAENRAPLIRALLWLGHSASEFIEQRGPNLLRPDEILFLNRHSSPDSSRSLRSSSAKYRPTESATVRHAR